MDHKGLKMGQEGFYIVFLTLKAVLRRKVPGPYTGVSIIFKIQVFYKAQFEGFEFFIRWPYAVFHKMQVVFYKSAHFMYL